MPLPRVWRSKIGEGGHGNCHTFNHRLGFCMADERIEVLDLLMIFIIVISLELVSVMFRSCSLIFFFDGVLCTLSTG